MKINKIYSEKELKGIKTVFNLVLGSCIFQIPEFSNHTFLKFECLKCGNCCCSNIVALAKDEKKILEDSFKSTPEFKSLSKKYQKKRFRQFKRDVFKFDQESLDLWGTLKDIFSQKESSPTGFFLKKIPLKKPIKIGKLVLREKCVFYEEDSKKCKIYKIRPRLCNSYPIDFRPIKPKKIQHAKDTKPILYHFCGFNFEKRENEFICNGYIRGKMDMKFLEWLVNVENALLTSLASVSDTWGTSKDILIKKEIKSIIDSSKKEIEELKKVFNIKNSS